MSEYIVPVLHKVYHKTLTASFGTLSQEKVNKLFQDGRRSSHFLEYQLEEWFPGLRYVDQHGYDFVNMNDENVRYDAKCFTRNGASFAPSYMLGGGRHVDEKDLWEHANTMIYIFCDVVEFPDVRIICKKGSDLLEYKKGKIPKSHREQLFSMD